MNTELQFKVPRTPSSIVDSLERGVLLSPPVLTTRDLEFKNKASTFGISTVRSDGVHYLLKYPLANGNALGPEIDAYVDLVNDIAKIVRQEFESPFGTVEINPVFRCDAAERAAVASELREGRSFGEVYDDDAGWDETGYRHVINPYILLVKEFRAFTRERCCADLGIDLIPQECPSRPSQVWDSFVVPSDNLNDFPRTLKGGCAPHLISVNPICFRSFRNAFYS